MSSRRINTIRSLCDRYSICFVFSGLYRATHTSKNSCYRLGPLRTAGSFLLVNKAIGIDLKQQSLFLDLMHQQPFGLDFDFLVLNAKEPIKTQ